MFELNPWIGTPLLVGIRISRVFHSCGVSSVSARLNYKRFTPSECLSPDSKTHIGRNQLISTPASAADRGRVLLSNNAFRLVSYGSRATPASVIMALM